MLLELFAMLTIVSLVYNAATADGVKPATALYPGPFVHVDGKAVAYRRWGARGTPIILLGGFVVPSFVWDGGWQATRARPPGIRARLAAVRVLGAQRPVHASRLDRNCARL